DSDADQRETVCGDASATKAIAAVLVSWPRVEVPPRMECVRCGGAGDKSIERRSEYGEGDRHRWAVLSSARPKAAGAVVSGAPGRDDDALKRGRPGLGAGGWADRVCPV